MLNYLLIKPKKISECFSCFWKVFCFEKFTKSKNLQLHILATHLQVASFMLQSQAQPEAFATTWRVKVLVEKKDLEFFSKILGFSSFRDLVWQHVHEWKLQL